MIGDVGAAPGGLRAFWSYTRADDQATGQRISGLRRQLADRLAALTAEEPTIFLDEDGIEWGRRWRPAIEAALHEVAFLIPILTPRYFTSEACRSELRTVLRLSGAGRPVTVLPIHYIEVAGIRSGTTSTDDLVLAVKELQCVEWQEIALKDERSSVHVEAVDGLARRLLLAHSQSVPVPVPRPVDPTGATGATGPSDLLASVERARLEIEAQVQALGRLVDELARLAEGDGAVVRFGDRIDSSRRLARQLEDPSAELEAATTELRRTVTTVDAEVAQVALRAAGAEQPAVELLATVGETARSAEDALSSLEELAPAINAGTAFSPEMRGPNESLAVGAERGAQVRAILRSWSTLGADPPLPSERR